jgi:alanine racemase
MAYHFLKIAEITGGTIIQSANDSFIDHLLIDSRKILHPESSVFIAINGAHHDGHKYLKEVYQSGVRNFIVEQIPDELPSDSNMILVNNSLNALQTIAASHREEFSIPIVGITGSNGKTIVKEWIYQLLHEDAEIVRSPKSYNSQVGVPLSVWQMDAHHQLALFEAGISHKGEMALLEKIIRPQIGIFTNIGSSHDEGFVNRTEKIAEKLGLFAHSELLICSTDDAFLFGEISKFKLSHPSLKLLTWSATSIQADIQFEVEKASKTTTIKLRKGAQYISVHIPFTDDASIQNACTCFAFLASINRLSTDVLQRFSKLEPIEMRLRLKEGNNNCILINDSYSADMQSLQIALDFMTQQAGGLAKTVILSDIIESGLPDEKLYQAIAELLKQKQIKHIIGIGAKISKYHHLFEGAQTFYPTTEAFLQSLHKHDFRNQIILLKGARKFAFEKINERLEKRVHETVFEINLSALIQNLNVYRNQLKPGTKIMAMVKAFSYGAGSYEIARILEFHRVDYLAVAYADEGVILREAGIKLPIMVMNVEVSAIDQILKHNLEPVIYSKQIMTEWIKQSAGESAGIHIEIDTGMKRLGFNKQDIPWLIDMLTHHESLTVKSVFAHLAASEDKKHDEFTREQIASFGQSCKAIQEALTYPILKHTLNSGGIIRFPEAHFDMVRLGIGLYGIDPSHKIQKQLQQIGTLKTVVSQIHEVASHETVGYNRKGVVNRNSKIATVAIGYADGHNRKLGHGKGYMIINNQKAPVVGSICMDMTMLDVTDINCKEGDEVTVFGGEIAVQEIAEKTGTIPYEVLTSISQRVKRVYFLE